MSKQLRPASSAIGSQDLVAEVSAVSFSGVAQISGITHDSRCVLPGDLYVAVPGFKMHGIDFAKEAVAAGAVAILSDSTGIARAKTMNLEVALIEVADVRLSMAHAAAAIYGHPEQRLKLIGVTGTNGKTTTSHLIRQIGAACGVTMGTLGTLGTFIGETQVPSARTTPESTDLYALLGVMVEQGVTHVVMEVSSHALALNRVAGLHFSVAIFTNLSQDHLDFHPTMDDYFATKAQLFAACDNAIICVDTHWGRMLANQLSCPVQTVGLLDRAVAEDEPLPEWCVADVAANARFHTEFLIRDEQGQSDQIELAMVGAFNATNAALALAAWKILGLPRHQTKKYLAEIDQIPGRLELVTKPGALQRAVVDYAHTPDAIAKVLDELRIATQGKLITVFGCGGDRDPLKRPIMGQVAAERSDVVIVTDDNPRSEVPANIRQAVLAGAIPVAKVTGVDIRDEGDRRRAIALAVEIASPNDLIAVLGKGHESGQEIAGVVYPFDDREVLREVLR